MDKFSKVKLSGLVFVVFVTLLGTTAYAQSTLIDLIKAGRTADALAAIEAGADVNAREADGTSVLMQATYQVNLDVVAALIDAGAAADVTNNYGSTALAEAVKLDNARLVEMLLAAGADADSPNLDNQTALMLAAYMGNLEIAKMLVEAGASINATEKFRGQTALIWAASENHPDVLELLLAHGADVSVKAFYDDWPRQMTSEPRAQFLPTGGLTALLYATRSGCLRCAKALVEAGADINQPNPDGVTPLLNAIDNKNFDIAMYLIDQGARVESWDMNGRTPLLLAVDMHTFAPNGFGFGSLSESYNASGRNDQGITAMDVANRLLDMGVEVDHQMTRMRPNGPGRGRFADYDMRGGTTALLIAVFTHDHEAITTLLARGANPNLRNVYRISPLMYAAGMSGNGRAPSGSTGNDIQQRAIRTIDLLLDAGADINAQVNDSHTFTAKLDTYIQWKDNEGRTALHSAAELGWDQVAAHLVERGADTSLVDAEGKTALDLALEPIPDTNRPGRGPSAEGRKAVAELLGGLSLQN